MDRFCARLISEQPDYPSTDMMYLEELASYRLYSKPWYEYHAVQFLDWIESAQREVVEKKMAPTSDDFDFELLRQTGTFGRTVLLAVSI